jgi:hypothetical protein
MVENESINASLRGHESPDHCSLRQNLQSESSRNEESEKKRRKVVSQKGKLLVEISQGRKERLQILKRMGGKTEAVNSHNPVFTFFRNMAQTVIQFSPNIFADRRVFQLVGEMEAKQTNSFKVPFSQFFFRHFITNCCVTPVMVMSQLPSVVLLQSWSCPTSILSVIYRNVVVSKPNN